MQTIKNSGTQADWNAESVFSFLREKRILMDESYNHAVPESKAPPAAAPAAEVKKTEVKEKEPAAPVHA